MESYNTVKQWHDTHRRFLKSIAPEIVSAATTAHPGARFVNTKYIYEIIQENPRRYPLLASQPPRAMKGSITLCCLHILKWEKRTCSRNGHGGRIFERTDIL